MQAFMAIYTTVALSVYSLLLSIRYYLLTLPSHDLYTMQTTKYYLGPEGYSSQMLLSSRSPGLWIL
jgi:hypothetical protein